MGGPGTGGLGGGSTGLLSGCGKWETSVSGPEGQRVHGTFGTWSQGIGRLEPRMGALAVAGLRTLRLLCKI